MINHVGLILSQTCTAYSGLPLESWQAGEWLEAARLLHACSTHCLSSHSIGQGGGEEQASHATWIIPSTPQVTLLPPTNPWIPQPPLNWSLQPELLPWPSNQHKSSRGGVYSSLDAPGLPADTATPAYLHTVHTGSCSCLAAPCLPTLCCFQLQGLVGPGSRYTGLPWSSGGSQEQVGRENLPPVPLVSLGWLGWQGSDPTV